MGRFARLKLGHLAMLPDAVEGRHRVQRVKLTLAVGVWFALLTAYVYLHANTETFVIYLSAMTLWVGLFGYCVRSRGKYSEGPGTPRRNFKTPPDGATPLLRPLFAGEVAERLPDGPRNKSLPS